MSWFFSSLLGGLGALTVAALCAILLRSVILNWIVDSTLVRLLKDHYTENLWDVVVGVTRVPPHVLMELELRAEFGQTLERPLGSIRRLPDFAGVGFNPAQLITQPLGPQVPVDLTTILGPRAIHPLRLQIPLMISAMGYGVALSKPLVLALARGATRVGTAYNAGSGPVLDEILQETGHLVLQYGGGSWTRDEDLLSQADMIEINYGHGGRAALGRVISGSELPPEARK